MLHNISLAAAAAAFVLSGSSVGFQVSSSGAPAAAATSDCVVYNPGTPFCYRECATPPRLRACDDD